jgi:hypothetical protein
MLTRRSDTAAPGFRRAGWRLGAWVQAVYVCAAIASPPGGPTLITVDLPCARYAR